MRQQVRVDNLTICGPTCVKNKLMSVFNVSVVLLTMNFIINIVKVQFADPHCYRLMDPQLLKVFDNVMVKFIINKRTDT